MGIESDPTTEDPREEASRKMETDKASPEAAGEELSPTLLEIKDMDLNYDDDEYGRVARSNPTDRATSEDAFLRSAKGLIEGGELGPATWGSMLRILDRSSMKEHPKIDLFRRAVKELAEKFEVDLK